MQPADAEAFCVAYCDNMLGIGLGCMHITLRQSATELLPQVLPVAPEAALTCK
jgi:hypothetical protein